VAAQHLRAEGVQRGNRGGGAAARGLVEPGGLGLVLRGGGGEEQRSFDALFHFVGCGGGEGHAQ
jgi:hypothetical protein